MRWLEKWRNRRNFRRSIRAISLMIEEHLNNGGELDDLFLPAVDTPVEWDQAGQYWFVVTDNPGVEVGRKVMLYSGRGGAYEEALAVEEVEVGKFSLDFDVPPSPPTTMVMQP